MPSTILQSRFDDANLSVVLAGDGDRFFAPSDKLVLSIWSHPREEFLDLSISLVHETLL
jgi:hypothetical protein